MLFIPEDQIEKKEIRIGEQYQATPPPLQSKGRLQSIIWYDFYLFIFIFKKACFKFDGVLFLNFFLLLGVCSQLHV